MTSAASASSGSSPNTSPVSSAGSGVVMGEDIDKVIKKTTLGQIIIDYKNVIFVVVGILLTIIAVVVFYQHQQSQKMIQANEQLFSFEQSVLQDLKNEQIAPEQFLTEFQKLIDTMIRPEVAGIHLAQVFRVGKEAKLDDQLISIYQAYLSKVDKRSILSYLASLHLAVLLEDTQDLDGAIGLLKGLLSHPMKVEDKLYFDLGRLELAQSGETGFEKAQKHFNFLIEKFPDSDYAAQAKAILLQSQRANEIQNQ